MNRIEITVSGRLTGEPELRYTSNGTPVCNFRLAHNRSHRDRSSGQWVNGDPDFFEILCWKNAEAINSQLHKGQAVVICGDLQIKNYQDKKGVNRLNATVAATLVAAVVSGKSTQSTSYRNQSQSANPDHDQQRQMQQQQIGDDSWSTWGPDQSW